MSSPHGSTPCPASVTEWRTLQGHPQPGKGSLQSVPLFLSGPGSPEPPHCLATVTPLCALGDHPATGGSPFPLEGRTEFAFQGILK